MFQAQLLDSLEEDEHVNCASVDAPQGCALPADGICSFHGYAEWRPAATCNSGPAAPGSLDCWTVEQVFSETNYPWVTGVLPRKSSAPSPTCGKRGRCIPRVSSGALSGSRPGKPGCEKSPRSRQVRTCWAPLRHCPVHVGSNRSHVTILRLSIGSGLKCWKNRSYINVAQTGRST